MFFVFESTIAGTSEFTASLWGHLVRRVEEPKLTCTRRYHTLKFVHEMGSHSNKDSGKLFHLIYSVCVAGNIITGNGKVSQKQKLPKYLKTVGHKATLILFFSFFSDFRTEKICCTVLKKNV